MAEEQMPQGFEAGLVGQQQPPSTPPTPPTGDDMPAGFEAGLVGQQQPQTELDQYRADLAAGRNPTVESAKRDWEKTKGFAKGTAASGAGILDMLNTDYYKGGNGMPFTGEAIPYSQTLRHFTDWVRQKSIGSNPEQEIGQIIEAGLEAALIPGGEGEAKGLSLAEKFGFGKDVSAFMEKYPFLRSMLNVSIGAGKTAARAGVEQYGQTLLKTGDEQQAQEAGKTGAVAGGVLGAGGAALGETAAAVRRGSPGVKPIAGANFETHPKTGDLLLRNLKEVGQDPATQAVDEAFGNMAQTGVVNSINRTNAARAPEGEIIPPSRQLPGGGGLTAGAAATETTPTKEGQILQPARKKQIGTRTVEGKGSPTGTPDYRGVGFRGAGEEPPPPREVAEPPTQQGSHREPINQYLTSARPGTETAVEGETGPPSVIFTDKGDGMSEARARQQLSQYNQILNDDDTVGQMGVRQHQQITDARDDLQGQLRRFDDYAASQPHFSAPDPVDIARNTSSLSEAADHLKGTYGRFWTVADAAAKEGGDETFSSLRDEEKRLRKQIYGENPTGKLDELRSQLDENQQKQMDFFDKYRTTVSPDEWQQARSGYQDGIVMQNLDDLLQKHFNAITRPEEARGVGQRVFDPKNNFNQQLEDFYNKGFRGTDTNRQVLQRTIGQDHMDNLKKIGVLFDGSKRLEQSQGLAKTILTTMKRHYHGVRGVLTTGEVGLLVAHRLGAAGGALSGPAITGGIAGTRTFLANKLISDPTFLRQFAYAVEKNLPPRTAGPLLAARMIATMKNQPTQPKKQEQQPEDQP
jgi:hypothetical protein